MLLPIQRRLLFLLIASMALAVVTVLIMLLVVVELRRTGFMPLIMEKILRSLMYNPGEIAVSVAAAAILFLFYYLLLSRRWARSFEAILGDTAEIARGNFDYQVSAFGSNEIGSLGKNLNHISVQLKKALEEERNATQAKNELITNVSHDLRTPLTSIIGYLRLIEEDRYRDEVELRHYTGIAYSKARTLERMVNDLFEYTRVNYSEAPLYTVRFDLIQLLNQVASEFLPRMEQYKMEARLHFLNQTIPIEADPDKLVRVFENLISNAISYGKEGRRVEIEACELDEQAIVSVKNYGSPIPALALPHIFDRFYRVEKSRSLDTGGSGLGLAISKSIVELHGGEIKAASNEEETVFTVMLPVAGR